MDLWFNFFREQVYPKWFWTKTPKVEEQIEKKDLLLLMEKLGLNKKEDLFYLLNNYPEIVQEELKYYKNKK